ncbi:MAG: hypothetical protein K9K38_13450 [Rhodoferax sp.]|nr:hypothetical protein [Rhodoferax sp.]MCF8210385.1 hypothetical protein [Rhodoferax sp.]
MANEFEFKVECTEMGPHEARIRYVGDMCQAGALALQNHFDSLFGYYKYTRIELAIESGGGAVDGLEYVLRSMKDWSGRGCEVAVSSVFRCASAAAFLLAMGQWGNRRVERGTYLLFHSARIESAGIRDLTAAASMGLAQSLLTLDSRLLDVLMARMVDSSGGEQAFLDEVRTRTHFVKENWQCLAADLTTFILKVDQNRQPEWLKAVQKCAKVGLDPKRGIADLKKHLFQRFQKDDRMDVSEAFCLCLIDGIEGVIDANVVRSRSMDMAQVPSLPIEADHFEIERRTTSHQVFKEVDVGCTGAAPDEAPYSELPNHRNSRGQGQVNGASA